MEEFKEACLLLRSEGVSYAVEKLEALQAEVKCQFREVFVELKETLEVRKTLTAVPLADNIGALRIFSSGSCSDIILVRVAGVMVAGPPIRIVLVLVASYRCRVDLFIGPSWRREFMLITCWLRSQNKKYIGLYCIEYRCTKNIKGGY